LEDNIKIVFEVVDWMQLAQGRD